jgi:hypothetical protein
MRAMQHKCCRRGVETKSGDPQTPLKRMYDSSLNAHRSLDSNGIIIDVQRNFYQGENDNIPSSLTHPISHPLVSHIWQIYAQLKVSNIDITVNICAIQRIRLIQSVLQNFCLGGNQPHPCSHIPELQIEQEIWG